MNRYEWIVFDSTGTLMRPDPEAAVVYHEFMVGAIGDSAAVSSGELKLRLREAMRHHFSAESAADPTNEERERKRWRDIVDMSMPELDSGTIDEFFSDLWTYFGDPKAWAIYDEVLSLVDHLRASGYRIAVASNFDLRLKRVIEGFPLRERVDQLLISSQVGWSKPNVEFYVQAGRILQLDSPKSALMIGDTKPGDVDAPIKVGWDALHLVRDRPDALTSLLGSHGLLD